MTTVCVDRYGVKHIAPYSFHYPTTSSKKKDSCTTKSIGNQEVKTIEHGIKRK